jgi:predicted SnoaL-like aldol condensation-catalyzing enzyme
MMKTLKTLATLVLILALAVSALGGTLEEKNKKIVREFYEMAFNQHKPTEAAKKYIGDKYIQHNPYVPNGAAAFYGYFEGFFKEHSKYRAEIKRVIGDGDLVVLHMNSKLDDKDRGKAIVDIFRLENGKIVEHWDVIQDVPEKSANNNTMF